MMNIRSAALIAVLTASSASAAEWREVWTDEFTAGAIDPGKWTHEVNGQGGGNNELQYYTARVQNSFIQNGKLVIRAIKETFTGPDGTRGYTSARLNTRFKGDWLYGRIEVRAKLPGRQGLWPAIWMLPTDYEYGGWAASGEIDIMEHRGNEPNVLVTTIHHGAPWPGNVYQGSSTTLEDLTLDFHEYAIEWEPTQIRWYFDGNQVHSETSWWSSGGAYPAPFNKRFHLLLNLAVGGNFLPNPPANADYFPKDYLVDSVRVYEKIAAPATQTPFGSQPMAIPGRISAANFDNGGPEVAYHDNTSANTPGIARLGEQVDLENSGDIGGEFSVGYFEAGEWLEYTVNVARTDGYAVTARIASAGAGGAFTIKATSAAGKRSTLYTAVPSTGTWSNWTTIEAGNILLEEGLNTIRITSEEPEWNLNYLEFSPAPQAAFAATPQAIPGKVQMQAYDEGGQGLAYFDTTSANLAGTWRTGEWVDVGPSNDTDGANSIGYFDVGEWVEYTVDVQESNTYAVTARVASQSSPATLDLAFIDSSFAEATLSSPTPATGGWTTWADAPMGEVTLQAGTHIMRLGLSSGVTNVNYLQFTAIGPPTRVDTWYILSD